MNIQARGDFEYFVIFIDDYSRYGYIYLMHSKFECFEKFRVFKAEMKKRYGNEYLLEEFLDYLSEEGIESQLSALGMPQ